jgi:hypothetical protein
MLGSVERHTYLEVEAPEPLSCSSKKTREAVMALHFHTHTGGTHLGPTHTEVLVAISAAVSDTSSERVLQAPRKTEHARRRPIGELDAPLHRAASGSCCCSSRRCTRNLAENRREILAAIAHSTGALHESATVGSAPEMAS